jgi:CIC family chloride channel protein
VQSPIWHRILIPVIGSLGTGYLVFRYFPDARGGGVTQTKAALFARGGVISLRTIFGKFFCTSASLASGIPLGPEGPAVQIGAGIASVLSRRLGMRPENVKALIPVGAAAAIAAAFNTPLAAIVYSLEEIVGDMNASVLGSVVLASATAWLVLRVALGNNPLFEVPQYQLVHQGELAIYAVLGLVGGFVSVLFGKLLIGMRARFLQLPLKTRWFQPVAGGLLVGLLGWRVPEVLGVGYVYVGHILNGQMAVKVMVLLIVFKILAVTMSYSSGNTGGLFAPSLFIGALVGGIVGSAAHHLWPAYTALPGAYALVGMGALFAGIMRAPMTSVLDDIRDHARLRRDRAADDRKHGELLHFLQFSACNGERRPGGAGWPPPAESRDTTPTRTACCDGGNARRQRAVTRRHDGTCRRRAAPKQRIQCLAGNRRDRIIRSAEQDSPGTSESQRGGGDRP